VLHKCNINLEKRISLTIVNNIFSIDRHQYFFGRNGHNWNYWDDKAEMKIK